MDIAAAVAADMAVVDTVVAGTAVDLDAAGRGVEDDVPGILRRGTAVACVPDRLAGLRKCDLRLLLWSIGGRVLCILARLEV